ncbi:hypothetical protein Y032_0475g2125 [Ancylostoma ceylanicum]|uniref:Uncharacterized protein n=1 Tax=Ancylostoma ceylanicum TaxID=53326 RepID=A0A016WY71_9BILA|nr:hypothetical protein Y032_0475g2125 [Ancylostoma ceylanicum]
MTTVLGEGTDLLILSIFPFSLGSGGDMSSTGVLQCAEQEYDDSSRGYQLIGIIAFSHFRGGDHQNDEYCKSKYIFVS